MQARKPAARGRLGSVALVAFALTVLSPALAVAASVSPSRHSAPPPALKTVAWDGQVTFTVRSIDRGTFPLTYKAQYSWHVTWSYDPVGKAFRPATTGGSVTGTASRSVAGGGSTECSGPVTGTVGQPAVSVDAAGNAVFDASAIPGFAGGGELAACYGPVAPPIFPEMSRADFAFHAKTKLSRLLDGAATASDHGGASNTSTFQGTVCTKGCIAQTPATTGGYTPIGSSKPTPPNPSDPIYTYQASVSWSARVTAGGGGGCTAPADETLLAQAKANAHDISSKTIIDESNDQILKIVRYGRTVLAQYPDDQAMRKTLMNRELNDVQDAMRGIYAAARKQLAADAARDVARAKCPDTRQLIQSTYDNELPKLAEQEDTDLRYAASRAVKVITKNCGCVG